MKTEDFERLKAKLGDEFTAEYRVEKDSVMVLVTKKRVDVKCTKIEAWIHDSKNISIDFKSSNQLNKINFRKLSEFLAEQLEKYLNNEIE
jgi:hypothetical protein